MKHAFDGPIADCVMCDSTLFVLLRNGNLFRSESFTEYVPLDPPELRSCASVTGMSLHAGKNAFLSCFRCGEALRVFIATSSRNSRSNAWSFSDLSDRLCCFDPIDPSTHYSVAYLLPYRTFVITHNQTSSLCLVRLTEAGYTVEDTTDEPNCSVPMNEEEFETERVSGLLSLWIEEAATLVYETESGTLYSARVGMEGKKGKVVEKVIDCWRCEGSGGDYESAIRQWCVNSDELGAFFDTAEVKSFNTLSQEKKVSLMLEETRLRQKLVDSVLDLKVEYVKHHQHALKLLQSIGDEVACLARAVKAKKRVEMKKDAKLPQILEVIKELVCYREATKASLSEEENERLWRR